MIFVVFRKRKEDTMDLFQKPENRCGTKEFFLNVKQVFSIQTNQEAQDRKYLNRRSPELKENLGNPEKSILQFTGNILLRKT